MTKTVLITGASHGIGAHLLHRVPSSWTVRALSRRPTAGGHPGDGWAEWVQGDLEDPSSLATALDGVDAVAACHGADPALGPDGFRRVDFQGTANLIEAARVGGRAPLFIYVSAIYTGRETPPEVEPGEPFRWKREAEERLRASGLPYVVVRPSWLADGPGGATIRAEQGDTGEGRIDRADVARVIAATMEEPAARGKTFELYAENGQGQPTEPDWPTFFANLLPDREARHG